MANRISRLCIASIAIATIAVSAPMAVAENKVITGNDDGLSAEVVETQREQTLQIKKLPRSPYEKPDSGSKPYGGVQGLTFRLSKVQGVDVTTKEGRDEAKKYTVQRARYEGFSESREQITGADGVAVFKNLGPGLYLIEEFAPDEDHNWRLSGPQLVILPLGDVKGENFSYDNVLITKPEPETPPTTPETPGTPPSTPGKPGEPDGPPSTPPTTPHVPSDGKERKDGQLAVTGANVIWVFGIGLSLIASGFFLMRRKKKEG